MNIKNKTFNINRDEILKNLQMATDQPPQQIQACIDRAIQAVRDESHPQYDYKLYTTFKIENDTINLNHGELIINSHDLANHLIGSKTIVLLAVTAGSSIDRLIKKSLLRDPAKGLITDAVASSFVEGLADLSSEKIVNDYHGFRNFRYSPGYGDLSLTVQSKMINVLKASKNMGLYSTKNHMLIPSKSITGIFGLFPEPINSNKSCHNCHLFNDCNYRKRGVRCYD